jgi:WD40 repeat protein
MKDFFPRLSAGGGVVSAHSGEAGGLRAGPWAQARLAFGVVLGLLVLGVSGCRGTPAESELDLPIESSVARAAGALRTDEARWTPTGHLALGRLLHTAALLPSGQVLVAGGFNRTSELYDPAAGTWTRTGDTQVSRRYHTLTPLADGRALVAGGDECQTATAAEVYAPATGTWTRTGALVTCRAHHAAVALSSGLVLVVGGTDGSGRELSSAELYDPATGTWTATGSLGTARANPTATLLPSGRVLVTGGGSGGALLGSAELYDPATGTWTATGSMNTGRRFHTATLLSSGRVLVAGGGGMEVARAASAELYDPATGSWMATGALGSPRRQHTATPLADGKVLVAGGYHDYTGISSTSELYDPATGSWSGSASLHVNRYGHTATRLTDGRVLAVGGFSTGDQASAELYVSTQAPPVGTPPSGTSLLLQVVDAAGNPIAQAAVSARDSLFPTDSSGHLLLEDLTPGRFHARVDALGFTSASVVVELPEGAHLGHQVRLLPLGEPIPFEAREGGVIETADVRVSIPANAVVDALGQPVTGPVEVTVAPLDPTTQLAAMPGPLEGTSPAGGEPVPLESFFMAEVSLRANGAPAQLAPGATATLEFVLPEALASQFHPGDSVPAWWFDLDAGHWRQEGLGTIEATASGQLVWRVVVKHFTWWNCDAPITDRSCVNVRVVDEAGRPVPGIQVNAQGVSYTGVSRAVTTGSTGQACVEIKRGATADVFTGLTAEATSGLVRVTGSAAASVCGSGACTPVTLTVKTPLCVPGAYEPCAYTGPAGTEGKGLCHAGQRQCNLVGTEWSACRGEVVPAAESCRSPFDEDCDGTVNEDCTVCQEREGMECYTGPAGTKGVGLCRAGAVGCNLFGEVVCRGERVPRPEDCSTIGDEDCDGVDECTSLNEWLWTPGGSTSTCTGGGEVLGLAQDGEDNTLLLGRFTGTLDFGTTPLSGSDDLFVAKLHSSGAVLWSQLIDVETRLERHHITVDPGGHVLVAGTFTGALRVGGRSLSSGSGTSPFVVKLAPSGAVLWAQTFESTGLSEVEGLSVDPAGNVVLTGGYSNTLRIGSVVYPNTMSDAFYVAKLEGSTGAPLWSKSFRNSSWLRGVDVAADTAGNVFLTGSFFGMAGYNPFDFDGTLLSTSYMGPDVFVARLDGVTGSTVWAKVIGSDSMVELNSRVKVDGAGKVWVMAWIPGSGFLMARLDANGEVLWSHQNTGGHLERVAFQQSRMTFDATGNMMLSVWAYGPSNFGGGPRYSQNPAAYVVWYDTNGGHLADKSWQAVTGPEGYQMGAVFTTGLTLDASGRMLLGGSWFGTADLGLGPIISCSGTPFVLKFDPTP